ncbi:unnamed protein product [Thelazia callipaeda]|uniref:SERPIN domain-containing protein n=1 Tax=Thelazia callipaeda TaxID=103827 RepID=A0A0N5CR33_THECL|nr:unnamed protein product [Thelazia callipaeda]
MRLFRCRKKPVLQTDLTYEQYITPWYDWQTRFIALCFNSDVICCPKTLSFVISPLALSTLLYMLYLGANERTRKIILDLLHLKEKDVDNISRGYKLLAPFYKKAKTIYSSNLFLVSDVYIHPQYLINNTYEQTLQDIFGNTIKELESDSFVEKIHQLSGSRITYVETSPTMQTSMAGVAITVLEANWDAEKVYEYNIEPFETHYGMQTKQLYIAIKGRLRFYRDMEQESCCIPLKTQKNSNKQSLRLNLLLIRPRRKGEVYQFEKLLTENKLQQILTGIKNSQVTTSVILVPQMALPDNGNEATLVDMMNCWQKLKEENIFKRINEKLNISYCYHFASITLSKEGVGFMLKKCSKNITEAPTNPYVCHLQSTNQPFAIRYDTPFLFLLYESTYNISFIVGCYAGKPAIARKQDASVTISAGQNTYVCSIGLALGSVVLAALFHCR